MVGSCGRAVRGGRAVLAAALVLALAGCETPMSSGVGTAPGRPDGTLEVLRVDGAEHARGGPLSFRLVNTTRSPLGYNLCRSTLERQDDDHLWRAMVEVAEACTAEIRTLPPGAAADFSFRISPRARPGIYRIATDVHDARANVRLRAVSNTFRVIDTD